MNSYLCVGPKATRCLLNEPGFERLTSICSVIGKTPHGNDSKVVCIANIAYVMYKHQRI
jgi:hypothetical protein